MRQRGSRTTNSNESHHPPNPPAAELDLEPGLTLLEVPSPRSAIVHRIVCDRLAAASRNETAYWIDARNTASTHALYECASSRRVLDGLRVARAFTAYQHHSLVREVARAAGPRTGLIVAPNVADLYRDDDLAEWEREDLRAAALETLAELGRVLEVPVLATTARDDDAAVIAEHATTGLECVRTREGIRLERRDVGGGGRGADGAEGDGDDDGESDDDRSLATAGYWHGPYWQTTIPYWVEVCGAAESPGPHPAAIAAAYGCESEYARGLGFGPEAEDRIGTRTDPEVTV
ncbi:hypothetical protein ACFQGT_16975 [Natrialbaceae archaeon GCM10025810]|uniref:hypothetical protein n=1 Tax=Halovalidus salilacus TaxID=3075124 RepID=UPI0036131221